MASRTKSPGSVRHTRPLASGPLRAVHGYYDLPPWSPLDGRIAYTATESTTAPTGAICIMDDDGGSPRQLATSRALSPNDGAMAQWSADGSRIYFRDRDPSGQRLIGWVAPDTGAAGAMPGDLRMIRPTGHANAHHSHHGDVPPDRVPAMKHEHGVFVQDLDTGASRRLATLADCLKLHPRREEIADWHLYVKHTKWSPDGERLMFVFTNEISYDRKYGELPRVKDIYVINADGSGLRRVGEFGHHPLWHPNGREILANSPFPGREGLWLVLTEVDTGEQRLAATCRPGTGHPSFSPDGRWIAADVVDPQTGEARIELIDVARDTRETLVRTRVTDHSHAGTHLHPCWRQDGTQVLYASDADGTARLWAVDV